MDWVRIYELHNSYEWAVQRILNCVDPWGDNRADMRQAVNTARQIISQSVESVSEEELTGLIKRLAGYLKIHRPEQVIDEDQQTLERISAEAARIVGQGNAQGNGVA